MHTLIDNFPLMAAIVSILFAQVIKVPLHFIANRKWKAGFALSSGGMPSSHSAAVASLSTSIGIVQGVSSPVFAVSVVFSMIIMFDAAGVRRHAGKQAMILNKLIEEFQYLFNELGSSDSAQRKQKALKELIGHRPSEVFVGALVGVGISLLMYTIYH